MAKDVTAKDRVSSNPYLGDDVLKHLADVIPDTPEMRRVGKQEWLRLALTNAVREARKRVGMSQGEVAQELGVSQSWVSKLESANHDHQIESVVSLLDAVGAELLMAIKVNSDIIPVQPQTQEDVLVSVPYFVKQDAEAAGMTTREFVCASVAGYHLDSVVSLPSKYLEEGYNVADFAA